jgi:hypothetical protein
MNHLLCNSEPNYGREADSKKGSLFCGFLFSWALNYIRTHSCTIAGFSVNISGRNFIKGSGKHFEV